MKFGNLKIYKNNWENIFCFLVLFIVFLLSPNSFAADSLSYSGRLVKADGSPVVGPVNLTIDLAYTNTPGTILCSQNFSSVPLSNGVFHLKLDLVCPGPPAKTLTEILTAVPATFAAALRVSDVTNSKIYSFQEIHSMPFANISETAKQLAQLGAVNGEVLKWNDTTKKWEPSASGGGGTVTTVTVSAPLAVTSGATTPAVSISKATTTTDGYLSATDWNTFNNKVGVVTGGTTAQYYRGDNSWQTLNSDVVPVGVTNLYFTNALALGVPLGATLDVVNLAGAISSADTILTAFGRAQKQINLINANSSAYVTKTGTSTLAAGTIDAQAGFVLVGAPGSINDATPRGYVDTQDNLKVNKAGDTITGVLTLNNDLLIKGGSNYVTLKGHATSAAYNFVLPSSAGLSGEVLKTDGAGNLSWVNPATVAAGSATVDSTAIVNGTIVDADIANTTISYNKLNLTDGDIPLAKLNGVSDATKYLRADKSWQTLNGAAVANTPAGSIAATSTQAALNELDSEKEAAVTAGLATDYYKGNKTWSDLGADVRASQLTGLGAGTNTALVATDSILTAFQNTQAQINSKQNAITKLTDQDLKSVRLYGANATNYVELTAGVLTANRSLIFPDANGTSGQVLTTNGAGVLSWSSAATTASAVGGDLTGTIANAQLGAGVVGNTELANDAVVSANILDGTIVNTDLANTTIAYAKLNLADGDIPLAKINGASDATKYLRGDKSWSTFATDAIASALAGFTPFATKTDIAAGDSIFTAFQKTQKQLDDIDGDYVSKSGDNTVTGTFNISGIIAFLNIPTPTGTTLNEAANVDYVKSYVGAMGQWTKGTGGNAADIYFSTGKVGIGTSTPGRQFTVSGASYPLISVQSSGSNGGVLELTSNGDNVTGKNIALFNQAGDFRLRPYNTVDPAGITVLQTSGNVGIGLINPSTRLEVLTSTTTDGAFNKAIAVGTSVNGGQGGWIGSRTASANQRQGLMLSSAQTLTLHGDNAGDGSSVLDIIGGATPDTVGDTNLLMRVNSNGNVGIGTATPASLLHVNGSIRAQELCDLTGGNCKSIASGWGNVSAATMIANWPDAIVCDNGTDKSIMYHDTRDNAANLEYYGKASGTHWIRFNATTGAFYDATALAGGSICSGKSISTLVAEGRTFGLLGGGVDWTTNGTDVYRSGGKVGIGTSAPLAKLDLRDAINRSIQITPSVDNTASGVSKIEFRHNDNGNVNALYASIQAPLINGGLGFNAGELAFYTAPQTAGNPAALERLRITNAGNVGIGTATPTAKLEVAGNIQLSGGGTIVQEAWITPSYLNGWLDYATSGDTNWGPTAYYKGTDGRVYLRGLARAGTCGTAIFNLPAGYRPAKYRTFSSVSMDLFVRVNIAPNGDVIAVAGCNNSWVSLDGISFRVVGD